MRQVGPPFRAKIMQQPLQPGDADGHFGKGFAILRPFLAQIAGDGRQVKIGNLLIADPGAPHEPQNHIKRIRLGLQRRIMQRCNKFSRQPRAVLHVRQWRNGMHPQGQRRSTFFGLQNRDSLTRLRAFQHTFDSNRRCTPNVRIL